jgi:hypothetical protein
MTTLSPPPAPPRLEDVLTLIDEMSPADRSRLLYALGARYTADGKPDLGISEQMHRLRC